MKSPAAWALAFFLLGLGAFYSFPAILLFEQDQYRLAEPYFGSPVPAPSKVLLLRNDSYGKGYFGASRNGRRTHQGLDLLASVGGEVYASKSGRVMFAGEDRGYGLYVEILHPNGLITRYAHLSRLKVVEGDWAAKGDVIGSSGKTGNAKDPRIQPHLHFEIRSGHTPLNPAAHFFSPTLTVK